MLGALNTVQYLLQHPLTRKRPLESLARFARWQISSRIAIGPIAVSFVDDARLLVAPGMTGATGNIYVGLHEYEDMAFVLHCLRKNDLFVDVGANVGSYTVLAAKAAGANVIAFEPIASAYRHLCDNISLNAIGDRVDARPMCVGAANGVVAMTSGYGSANHVVHKHSKSATTLVPVTTLDDALEGRSPFMIKLDVEGYELEALRGASRTLADEALQCVLLEIGHGDSNYGHTDADLFGLMQSLGFKRYVYSPTERHLEPLDARQAGNALFVRDFALVQQRLSDARAFRVLDRTI